MRSLVLGRSPSGAFQSGLALCSLRDSSKAFVPDCALLAPCCTGGTCGSTWLIGHNVNRGRLMARQFSETLYQTTLAECFPLYFNHKAPSYVMAECSHFHSVTGLCWQPKPPVVLGSSLPAAGALPSLQMLPGVTSSATHEATSLEALHAVSISARADTSVPSAHELHRLRALVSIGIKAVTHLRNHVHFILHSIHRR